MPNKAYNRGYARELQWEERRAAQGYEVVRPGGSKGPYDLACLRHDGDLLEQLKTDKRGPFAHFGPAERGALLLAADRAGATANLIWWPPDRKGPRIIPASEWP